MSESERNPDNYCYRHPDRESYILCQRCGRTICPLCQTQAAVGVHCPECVKDARGSVPKRKPAIVTAFRRGSSRPVVTYTLMGILAVTFLAQLVTGGLGGAIASLSLYSPQLGAVQPWRIFTTIFVHIGLLQILFNLLSVWLLGRILEPSVGRLRFIAIFLLSGIGGSLGTALLGGSLYLGIGAAITGLIVAIFVIQYRQGFNNWGIVVLVGLNIVYSVVVSSVLLPGIIGGILAGVVAALIISRTSGVRQERLQLGLLVAFGIIEVIVTVVVPTLL